nr:uncharacterized protein LOC111427781 [Onthophagus taurus]
MYYTTLTGILTLILLFVLYLKRRNDYWKNRKVPFEKANLLVGNMWETISISKNAADVYDYVYKKFDDAKYVGVMNFGIPTLLVKDPEIYERILIRDFSKFHDNGIYLDEKRDPILSKNPFFAKGENWKLLRNQLTPQLSPLKIKNMFPLMIDVKDRLVKYLRENANAQEKEGLDAKLLSLKYANEMVASCAFGLHGNCFNDDKCEIMQLANDLFNFKPADFIIFIFATMFPIINKFRAPQFLSSEIAQRFKNIIVSTIKERNDMNIRRGDFLDAILELRKKTTSFEYTEDHMTAHATSFFIDGSATTSGALTYILYELARNKDVQEKLRNEFKTVLEENDNQMTFDALNEIEYLEMILHESLRMHAPQLYLVKECTETTTLPPALPGAPEVVIEKGTNITIPVYSLHKDAKYFENPEEFIPERFLPEAVSSRPKATYMAFGDGPRVCIGRRFASAVIKVATFGIVMNFNIEVNDKTPQKLELDSLPFLYATKGGIWLNFLEQGFREMYTTLVGLFTLLLIFFLYLKKRNEYWKNRKVPYRKANLLVGNMWESLLARKNVCEVYDDLYKEFDNAKYCGVMNIGTPTLMVKEPELLERILIKDFSKFHDNGVVVDEKKDAILSKNPFVAKGETWKNLRNQLTPQFSPLKIKNMYPLMVEVKNRLLNYIKEEPNSQKGDGLDAKDLTLRYTNEIVASCGFGLYGNCFNTGKSEIVELSKGIFITNTFSIITSILTFMFPIILKVYIPRALSSKVMNKFKEMILTTMKERKEKNIRRGDFLDGIMEIKEKSKSFEYTEDHMTAHSTSFFIDGTLTTAGVLEYVLYELARNKGAQDKLRQVLTESLEQNNGEMTHDVLQGIEYLNMILNESLRMHSPVLFLLKTCTKTTILPPPIDGYPEVTIEKGTNITIPVYSIHKDPKYFENPNEFIPERFSIEAKSSIPKISYLAFGEGPRICLGRRFSIVALKVALYGIITNFKIEVSEKTPKKLELDPIQFMYTTKGGIWLNFRPIN